MRLETYFNAFLALHDASNSSKEKENTPVGSLNRSKKTKTKTYLCCTMEYSHRQFSRIFHTHNPQYFIYVYAKENHMLTLDELAF